MNQLEEIIKCRNDFTYFAENYLKIVHPIKGLIPFHLFDFQKRLVKEYEDNRFVIVKKFRQGGFTTLTALYGLWRCMFYSDQQFMIILRTDREACFISSRIVAKAIENLPEELQPKMLKDNDHNKYFADTGSRMNFFTFEACCGVSLTHLVIDEPAFIPDMDQNWKALYPTLSVGGKCFAVGTVNRSGNWFEKTYHGAEKRENNFKIFECHYKEHPDYQSEEWAEKVKKNLGQVGWDQEMEGKFL